MDFRKSAQELNECAFENMKSKMQNLVDTDLQEFASILVRKIQEKPELKSALSDILSYSVLESVLMYNEAGKLLVYADK